MVDSENGKQKRKIDILLSPWMILTGIFFGVVIGVKMPALAAFLAPIGDIYLSLFQMCIIPIIITAVVSSIGHLISSGEAGEYIRKLIVIFVAGFLIVSMVGMFVGIIGGPGKNLNADAQKTLGGIVFKEELKAGDEGTASNKGDMWGFISAMVPKNIFEASSQGKSLAVLFFSIVLGIALGCVKTDSGQTVLAILEALYEAFLKIIGCIMYALPFGLMCLFANQISQVGYEIMFALLKLVVIVYIGSFIMMFIYTVAMWSRTGGSFFYSLKALKETLILALGTSSSFAAIPSAISGLSDKLKFEKSTTNLVIPLGVSVNPHGSILHFSICTVFIAQLYGVSLGPKEMIILIIGSILGGMAASGVPGLGGLTVIALILAPLGLPIKISIILLSAIDPILDPILSTVSIHANCAVTALIAKKKE